MRTGAVRGFESLSLRHISSIISIQFPLKKVLVGYSWNSECRCYVYMQSIRIPKDGKRK